MHSTCLQAYKNVERIVWNKLLLNLNIFAFSIVVTSFVFSIKNFRLVAQQKKRNSLQFLEIYISVPEF